MASNRTNESHRDLGGTIAEELVSDAPCFSPRNAWLLRTHGVFQQQIRKGRFDKKTDSPYGFMVRIRTVGGLLSPEQWLGLLHLADEFGDGQLQITSRQGIQINGIEKSVLRPVMKMIGDLRLTTIGTGGACNCSVMCCPTPHRHGLVYGQLQMTAESISQRLLPTFAAYGEIWFGHRLAGAHRSSDAMAGDGARVCLTEGDLLPHKFKVALATPCDNCCDVYAHDIGLLALTQAGKVEGYNLLVGGSMRTVLSVAERSPALAQPLAFVPYDQVVSVVSAVFDTYRRHGDRSNRSRARLKYLIRDWGLPRFRAAVAEQLGGPLAEPHALEVCGYEDHLGWHPQGDGRWYLGVHVPGGCISDTETCRLKSAVDRIARRFAGGIRLTPQQNILFADIDPSDCIRIERLLRNLNIPPVGSLGPVERHAMACPALPSCRAAITDGSRLLPEIITALESEVAQLGLTRERFTVRITGCPFGCTRSYLADIALVGRTVDTRIGREKYAIFVGGDTLGRRLNMLYEDLVPVDQLIPMLRPLLRYYQQDRLATETLGDFCYRKGVEQLKQFAENPCFLEAKCES